MGKLLAVYAILLSTALLTIRNIIALLAHSPLHYPRINIVCLYLCGALFLLGGYFESITIPSALRDPEHSDMDVGIALKITTKAGGLEKIVKHGHRVLILGVIAIALGIFLQKNIDWSF
jgi:hypothetical protein